MISKMGSAMTLSFLLRDIYRPYNERGYINDIIYYIVAYTDTYINIFCRCRGHWRLGVYSNFWRCNSMRNNNRIYYETYP